MSSQGTKVLVVGAMEHRFAEAVRQSRNVEWWGRSADEAEAALPNGSGGLQHVFVRRGLGHTPVIRRMTSAIGLAVKEFDDERELFATLTRATGIEADPAKAPAKPPRPPDVIQLPPPRANASAAVSAKGSGKNNNLLRMKYEQIAISYKVPIGRVRPNPNQPRKFFDIDDDLKRLAASIKMIGQRIPATVREIDEPDFDYEIVDGERRWKACQLAGVTTFKVTTDPTVTSKTLHRDSAVSNFGRVGHVAMEAAWSLKEDKEAHGLTIAELADVYVNSISWVTQHLSLLKMHTCIQEALLPTTPKDRQIKMSYALELGKPPLQRQPEALEYTLVNKLTLPQLRHYIRKLTSTAGYSSKQRERKPADDHKVLSSFVKGSLLKVGQLLDLPDLTIADMFRNRSHIDCETTITDLTALISHLTTMRDSIQAVYDGPAHSGPKTARTLTARPGPVALPSTKKKVAAKTA